MSESKHIKIHIERIQKGSGFAEITDVETKGKLIYEELMPKRASEFVKCWNSHDALLEALRNMIKQFKKYAPHLEHEKCWEIIEAKAAVELAEKEG